MTRFTLIFAALVLGAPTAAQEPGPATPAGDQLRPDLIEPESNPADFDLARKKAEECEGEKFVFAWGAGARPTRVTLCSKKGATRAELVEMLDDAATKLDQSEIAEDRKVAIVQQIRAKIAEIQEVRAAAAPPPPPIATSSPPARAAQAKTAPATAPPAKPSVARAALPPKPRLSFNCDSPTDSGSGGSCDFLERDTRITVTAGEALPEGVALRFVRRGETRAEVALGTMRKGQSARLALPRDLCAGVNRTESRIEVVRSGQVVDSLGPFSLRC